MIVTSDDLARMVVEVCAGMTWGDPRSRIPDTEEHRAAWDRLVPQVAVMVADGVGVDVPGEFCA